MKDKDGNEVVFVINNEEGEYINHLKKYALCDNYPKPNRNDFNLRTCNIGRFVKVEHLKANANKQEDTCLEPCLKLNMIAHGCTWL